MKTMLNKLLVLAILLSVSGCGMRGQLVLPENLLFLNLFL